MRSLDIASLLVPLFSTGSALPVNSAARTMIAEFDMRGLVKFICADVFVQHEAWRFKRR